jgi:predicted NUDIX family phosphoesterase
MNINTGVVFVSDNAGDEVGIPAIELVLSERNLRTLLATINEENNSVSRLTETGIMMMIRAEPNDVHYKDRPAGLMTEDVELKLAAEELASNETLYVPNDLTTLDD